MDPCCTISQNTNISSIVAGHRKSNFELLRIISMFMVLGLHVNFKHIGIPELSATDHNYLQILFQTIVEAICLPAVNIFILISGWFSIKASLKGLISFIFQYIFVVSVSYGCYLLSSGSEITVNAILSCLGLSGYGWFYVSYIILYVLSPLLNKYFSCLSKKSSIRLIITIFILSTLFGWVGGNSNFNNGYSAVSFIPIYLLGRYLSLFCNRNSYWKHLFLFSLILNIFILF